MFKKAPSLGNSNALKTSERRNLAKQFSEHYNLELEAAKAIFPESLKQCKGTTSAGEHFTLFATPDGPVAFRPGKGEQGPLVPSVYTSANPQTHLPLLVTNDVVLQKLLEGADLFAPGLAKASIARLPDDLPEGSIVGVGTLSVPNAVRALGQLCVSAKQLKANAQGKAVEILHVEGDQLWHLGSKTLAQPREDRYMNSNGSAENDTAAVDGTSEFTQDAEALADSRPPAQTLPSLSQADVDKLLRDSVLYAISHILSKNNSVFPLTSSKFMDTYVLPSRPAFTADLDVSIKKSSHKNASAFLKQLKKDGLVTTKEAKGGDLSVIAVDSQHPDVKTFKSHKTVADAQKQEKKKEARQEQEEGKASQRTVQVVELYKPHGPSISFCGDLGISKDSYALPTEIRQAVHDYIASKSLINPHDPAYINLDTNLSSAVLKKGEDVDFMPRSEVVQRLLDNMQAWHKLTISENGNKEESMAKGPPKKISIAVKKRGKKLVTAIDGLETFKIPPQKLSEDLQVKCASSATFGEIPGSSPKKPLFEVVVQGSQIATVTKELVESWGVAKTWIHVVR